MKTTHQTRVGLIAWLVWLVVMLLAGAFDGLAQSFPAVYRHRDGRAFVLPNSKSRDTSWLKVGDAPVVIEKAAKPWPAKWLPLGERININPDAGTINVQGLPVDGELIQWRYNVDDKGWEDRVWQKSLTPGVHFVRIEYRSAGYPTQTRTVEFVMPGKPTGHLPSLPTNPGKTEPGKPKPDENRQDAEGLIDAATFPKQPGNLRYVPRLLLTSPTRTNDPDLAQVPPFTLSKWFTVVYGDAGDDAALRARGVNVFQRLNQPGSQSAVLIGRNILEPGDGKPGTKWALGIPDPTEAQDLRSRVSGFLGGQVTSDRQPPRLIAFDYEKEANNKTNPIAWGTFEALRRQMYDEARQRYPASQVGAFQDSHVDEGIVGRVPFESGGYVILNLWIDALNRHIDACEKPLEWKTAFNLFGEWVFERVMEGQKGLKWRAEDGKELIVSFWNLVKDGCPVDGYMTHRDDVAEGQVLAGLMSGPRMLWLWNAHRCLTPGCDPQGQHLGGTLRAIAALRRLSYLNPIFDENPTFFLPDISRDGKTFVRQSGQYEGHNRPAAYATLYGMGAAFWAYQWPDDLPVVLGVRSGSKVGIYAVLPRQLDTGAQRQFWIRHGDYRDTFITQGRENGLYANF